ncbi:HlyD family secretion protein [Flavisphingomonas formosensis]|uniref:HlyD family secretion protein n=1 Tax=Flavisphingomonas formosensis TaxID=861534 RepID=UPI0012F9B6E5|nr:HlyD family secretion protein [Sphingomonas formosensis]
MNEMTRIEADELVDAPVAPGARVRRLLIMSSVPVLLAFVAVYFWLTSGRTVSTDNAQIQAHVVSVSPEVSGRIIEMRVKENQIVKAGDVLYLIDPEPYRIALMQADAAVGNAQLDISQLQGSYSSKVADIGEKAADVQLAQENFRRQAELLQRGFTTRAAYDAARAALASAQAQQNSASASADAARAMLGVSDNGGHPQVEAAIAARDKAALDLRRTVIRSPMDGRVSQADKIQPGAMAIAMFPGLSIVSNEGYWIDANFKETQLPRIRIGQRAEVEIDAIPGRTYKAHVTGIGAGTGSAFSVLPAQNATGNWVKVTQRVAVRLVLDDKPDRPLVSGWSAHVTVHVAE